MRLSRRDILATLFVLAGALVYVLWLVDHPLPGMSSLRVVAFVVLGSGVAASASAVVPSFTELLHGSKMYLVGTSLIGVLALVAAIIAVFGETDSMLVVLVVATAVLWVIATIRHMTAAARDADRLAARPSGT
jgi:hypothetical protein